MKATNVPTSKAKTAYALLSEIRALILKEPKRYNQERFLAKRGGAEKPPKGFPSCGTVGCVAGWVVSLKHPDPVRYQDVEFHAQRILGLSFEANRLFSGAALDTDGVGPAPQTAAHARAGAAHIRRFQKQYKAQLLATKV